MKIPKLIRTRVRGYSGNKIQQLKQEKRQIFDGVAVNNFDLVEKEPEESVWSTTAPGGTPSNTLFIKDDKDARPPTFKAKHPYRMRAILDKKDDTLLDVQVRLNPPDPTVVIRGVSFRQAERIKQIDKDVVFWQTIQEKYGYE